MNPHTCSILRWPIGQFQRICSQPKRTPNSCFSLSAFLQMRLLRASVRQRCMWPYPHSNQPRWTGHLCLNIVEINKYISPLKSAIRRYCDEGHGILTTSDVYEALQARQVKGTTAVVCEIDRKQGIKVNPISNFSAYHNFSYGADGLRVSKAYGVGPGKLILWSDLTFSVQVSSR